MLPHVLPNELHDWTFLSSVDHEEESGPFLPKEWSKTWDISEGTISLLMPTCQRNPLAPKFCRSLGEARRVSPFIVVPGRDRDKISLLHLGQGEINNRRMVVADYAR